MGDYWGKFRVFLPDIKLALKDLNVNTIKRESIDETVSYLKDKIFNI